ncbi:MAG: aspartate aminotransferase family protein [Neptuniibacter sp.]
MAHSMNRQTFNDVMVPNYSPLSMIPVTGRGSRVWDQQGKEYIDFAAGIAVNVLGHCHPALLKTLHQQAERLWHLSNVWTNEPAIELASRLTQKTFADRVYFANSGAEANEAAFKLARKHAYTHYGSDKNEIISCHNSFHGRTLFTVSVGGQPKYCEGFEPVPKGITHIPFNNISALTNTISETTCAVVLEPIQGEGGIIPATSNFLTAARQLCDKHKALLIFDEIQTGVGRTGALYAYQHSSIIPDILTTAKALGGGFPIAAMLCRDQVAQSFSIGSHGSTYGGNPLGCAVANKVLEIVDTPSLLEEVTQKHSHFMDLLLQLNKETALFSEFRGQGLLIGCELQPEYQGKARKFIQIAEQHGLMLLIAGPDVIRLTPSLIIPDNDIEEGMKRFRITMQDFIKAA